jgi:hypothetical protein
MSEGYFFIALGKRFIDECYNLTLTIKKQNDNRPVSLLIYESDLEYCENKKIFDKFVFFKPNENCKIWKILKTSFEKFCLYPRLHLNEYIPYDASITVDSDVLCQYSSDEIWKTLKNSEFPVKMVGKKYDLNWHWGTIQDVIDSYGKHVPHVHGGFFYIEKQNKKTIEFFDYVQTIIFNYDKFNCKRWYQNGMVDEILFAIAHSYFNIEPIEFSEYPIMTFNYDQSIQIPSNYQTVDNQITLMKSPIPFVHMFDKLHGEKYKSLLSKILNQKVDS